MDRWVAALAFGVDGALYVGGAFSLAGTEPSNNVARVTGLPTLTGESARRNARTNASAATERQHAGGNVYPLEPRTCPNESCFQMHVSQCTRGTSFTTPAVMEARARYEVLGANPDGCRVSLVYVTNPNPRWIDKPLLLTLDPAEPFVDQVMQGMMSCMSDTEERFDCAGPLRDILRASGAG